MAHYHVASYADRPARWLRIAHEVTIAGYRITLYQTARDRFAVQYGMQVDDRLPYVTAAAKLGEAIMHAATCEGLIESAA